MRRLRWVVFPFWLVAYLPLLLFRQALAWFMAGIAWLLKWVLALVLLIKHGPLAMDAYLEGCK